MSRQTVAVGVVVLLIAALIGLTGFGGEDLIAPPTATSPAASSPSVANSGWSSTTRQSVPFLGTQVTAVRGAPEPSLAAAAVLPAGTYGVVEGQPSRLAFVCNSQVTVLEGPDDMPVQALLAAAEQYVGGRGCPPSLPDGAEPAAVQPVWAVPFLRLLDRARLPVDFGTSDDALITADVSVNAAAPVPLRLTPRGQAAPEGPTITLNEGEAVQVDQSISFGCHPDSTITTSQTSANLDVLLDLIVCRPEPAV